MKRRPRLLRVVLLLLLLLAIPVVACAEAFGAIMRHHLPFVYTTCKRELCSVELAQDAAQVVFLILARKAATVRNGTVLAAWLFQTARFVSHDIRKKDQRRMLHEQQIIQQPIPTE